MYSIYVKLDSERNITAIDSDAFLSDTEGWIKVDEGEGNNYYLAQSNYLPQPLMADSGKYRYSLDANGQIVENDLAPTLDELKAAKSKEIAAARYAAEIAGISFAGAAIRTDRESQALITGAALAAINDAETSVTWKAANGFITLSAAQIIAVAQAVRDHVEACFNQEAELQAEIDAAVSAEEVSAITWITEDA